MMEKQIIVVTGAGSGLGRSIAEALALAGHTVFASMRSLKERNITRVNALLGFAKDRQVNLRVLELGRFVRRKHTSGV
jgi:NAD(P)-dependent dehydrogenase (short-subunit alcohol dehydrogenase family)